MPIEAMRKLTAQLPGVVYQFRMRPDGSSYFPFASAALLDIYRVSPEVARLDASAIFSNIHPSDYAGVVASINASALVLLPWQHEYRVKFDDGTIKWLFGHAIPEREADGSTLWHGFITDITARKLAEKQEREVNRAVHLVSRCNELIIQAHDQQQMLESLCRELATPNGIGLVWAGLVSPGVKKDVQPLAHFSNQGLSMAAVKAAWRIEQAGDHGVTAKAVQTGLVQFESAQWGDPVRALWLTRQPLEPYLVVAVPIVHQGRVLGVFVIHASYNRPLKPIEIRLLQDLARSIANGLCTLSIRRDLEVHKVKLEEKLEELVLERTHEIQALNEALVQEKQLAIAANLAKSDFLANMSHELRTPLNAVLGLTALLEQSPLNPRQRDYAEKIQLSATGLRVLINDILDLTKIEANELLVEKTPFSLHDLLSSTAALLGLSIGSKSIEPIFHLAHDVPDQVIGDALRVKQILLNLISNAVKFTQAGSIELSVRCLLDPQGAQAGHVSLVFGVHDTGIGMTDETQKRIFDNFTQANESTSRLYGGSGLGLAISRRLASLLQGYLEVHSALGVGSEFYLKLPMELDRSLSMNRPVPQTNVNNAALRDVKILIVDDHPLVRDGLTQTCRQLGWQSHAVQGGRQALQVLRHSLAPSSDYDLVLLDWHMPVMDGLAMLAEIYQSAPINLPPVVLMVPACELEQAIIASGRFNIGHVVAKPLAPSDLRRIMSGANKPLTQALVAKSQAPDQPLQGMHVLVAEDNALNSEVIEQVLLLAGAKVTLVCNGQLAVDTLKANDVHCDVVLMDVQMPVMDGYTATRLIRGMGLTEIPILALTAHARPEDHQASMLAGMSAHLVKPLDIAVMLDTVAKLVAQRAPTPSKASKASISDLGAALNLPTLNVDLALNFFGGDRARYGQLLNKFMLQHGQDVLRARHHVEAECMEEALGLLHGLSGVAGSLQIPQLARLAGDAESAIRDKNTGNLQALLDLLQVEMDLVTASIQKFRATLV